MSQKFLAMLIGEIIAALFYGLFAITMKTGNSIKYPLLLI